MFPPANNESVLPQNIEEVAPEDRRIVTEGLVVEAPPEPDVAVHPGTLTEALNEGATPKPVPKAAGSGEPFPLAEPGEYYIGLWSGLPNYGCPYCSYATLQGPGAVELHILARIDQGNIKHFKALEPKKEI